MGKIFKALEKAAKTDPAKPAKTPSSTTRPAEKAKDEGSPPAGHKPVVMPKNKSPQPAVTPLDEQPAQPAMAPGVKERPEAPPAKVVKPSIASAKTVKPAVEPPPKRRPETKPVDADTSESNLQRPAALPERSSEPSATREKDRGNLALVNQQAADQDHPEPRKTGEGGAAETLSPAPGSGTAQVRKGVNVRYSRTRVQLNDPQKLRDNRVLSVFDDVDTANQFKILRTQILRKLKTTGGNSILVTSANPCEGKTFTSINLGISIAKEFDRTVLIVDADIRRPTHGHTDFSTEFFSLKVEKGLTDYLMGEADIEDVLINPGIEKLTLIPGGVPVANPPELLNSPRMEQMMADIKSRYASDRLVIVDGPALLPFPDAMILTRYVDGVLPVIEAEKTSSADLKKMMKHLKEVNLLGMVLNKNRS